MHQRRVLSFDATAHFLATSRGTFVAGCLLIEGHAPFVSWDQAEFVAACADFEGHVWWFGAQRHELVWLWNRFLELGLNPQRRTNARGYATTYLRVGQAQHRDATALWLAPLEIFSPSAPPPLGLPCVCKHRCGGHCSLKGELGDEDRTHVEAHLVATCEAIWTGLERLRACHAALDLDGCNSIGTTAWESAKRRADLPDVEKSRSAHAATQESIGAARTEVYQPRVARALLYDMSMAYNGTLARIDLPIGESSRRWGEGARDAFEAGLQGAYCAEVYSPPAHLPVLPYRSPGGQVAFPVGQFKGSWSRDELRYAISRGVVVDRWHSCQVYRETAPLLREWSEAMYAARTRYDAQGSDLSRYIKALAVSLPGVFGSSPYGEQTLWAPEIDRYRRCPCKHARAPGECPCRGLCCGGCTGLCGEPKPIGKGGDLWVRLVYRLLPRCHAMWNSLVLGATRAEVHRFALGNRAGDGIDLVAIKTDGLSCTEPREVEPGGGNGAWREEDAVVGIEPGIPVVHKAGNVSAARSERTGELVVKSSGRPRIDRHKRPRSDEQVARSIVGRSAFHMMKESEAQGWLPTGFREGLRAGGGKGPEFEMSMQRDRRGVRRIGMRVLEDGSGITRAPTAEEVDLWDQEKRSA